MGPYLTTARKRECERRAVPHLALQADPAHVELDEFPGERQPESRALDLLVCRPHLPELLEDRLLILGRDADSGIRHGNLGDPLMHPGADINPAPLGGELQGVGEEVEEHLLDLSLVPTNYPHALINRFPNHYPPPHPPLPPPAQPISDTP